MELFNATSNANYYQLDMPPQKSSFPTDNRVPLLLRDVLSRIADLDEIYSQVESRHTFLCSIVIDQFHNGTNDGLRVRLDTSSLLHSDIRMIGDLVEGFNENILKEDEKSIESFFQNIHDRNGMPPIATKQESPSWADMTVLVMPYEFDQRSMFSELMLLFVTAYFLGMPKHFHFK
jgi:hypothetical protein